MRKLLHVVIHQDCSTSKIKGTKLNREGNKHFPHTHAHTDLIAWAWKHQIFLLLSNLEEYSSACTHVCTRKRDVKYIATNTSKHHHNGERTALVNDHREFPSKSHCTCNSYPYWFYNSPDTSINSKQNPNQLKLQHRLCRLVFCQVACSSDTYTAADFGKTVLLQPPCSQ